jgi:hypothetical protein
MMLMRVMVDVLSGGVHGMHAPIRRRLIHVKRGRGGRGENLSAPHKEIRMAKFIDRVLGWATPVAPRTDHAGLASALKHADHRHDCLARRQGRCPGIDQCHDCPWSESVSRASEHK